ncbi:MAG: bifunctional fucokinase/fucose-1-phosphate guanylyltransferase [Chthoniobacterales bacterium]
MIVPQSSPLQYLLSLPPAMAAAFADLENKAAPQWIAAADPANSKLGSGGGVAHLLQNAWAQNHGSVDFSSWLNQSKKLLLMAGGQSRRLPAYAAVGKIMLPFKALRGVPGQRLDQTLLDVQLPAYESVLTHAPAGHRVLVTSGDVHLRFDKTLPPFPEVDVLGLGMWVRPEVASDFGVFFSRRDQPGVLDFFLQKPTADEIQARSAEHFYLVDTGMWLLSQRTVEVLFECCGWDGQIFPAGHPDFYELYAGMGLALGKNPTVQDTKINSLSSAVVALPGAEFYHLGTGRQLIESVSAIENREQAGSQPGWNGRQPHPDQHVLNSHFSMPLRRQENHTLWVENATIPSTWKISSEHVLTGIPPNAWSLTLQRGQCLDMVPIGEEHFAIRPYHIDDPFKGTVSDPQTCWLGESAGKWFEDRGISLADAGISPRSDIQQTALFPVVKEEQIDSDFIQWLFDPNRKTRATQRAAYLASQRLSAEAICNVAALHRVYLQRQQNLSQVLGAFIQNNRWNSFFKLDLDSTAATFAQYLPSIPESPQLDAMDAIHEKSFRAAVLRRQGNDDWQSHERAAFQTMRDLVVEESLLSPAAPVRNILDDQIIWARSPVRLDLAGGWSDTPPYCLEYGGAVVNVAVNLNGQPPIQVFAKLSPTLAIILRSIDLGIERRLSTYEEISEFDQPQADFSLAKAALALAGFLPKFHSTGQYSSLREQLRDFGGGIELTFLSAAPKGSGLGTSSILSATTLGALSELCGLGWDRQTLFQRSLALEQLLTTGGGWQDQAGGLHRGIKIIETEPGIMQRPGIRWLPEHLFEQGLRNNTILLYYTGITRMAKNILQEIVRGMFLNSRKHLDQLDAIRTHGHQTFDALQSGNWDTLCAAVRHSWELNQALDAGTNPPQVQAILVRAQPHISAAKLLGAGGGGYLLFFANDASAAQALRMDLTTRPPNATARFVEFGISQTGLAITRS